MGDRANVVFKEIRYDKQVVSPVVYLHWQGSDVLRLLNKTKIQMEDRTYADDVCARFIQRASNELTDLIYSIAVNNSDDLLTNPYPWATEDNGVYIVDMPDWKIRHIINMYNDDTGKHDRYKFTDYEYVGFITGWKVCNEFIQTEDEVKQLQGLAQEINELDNEQSNRNLCL